MYSMPTKTTRARKNLGDSGERVAALFLEQRGYKILARNFRTRAGEVDLVAQDADGLAFVEVRTRNRNKLVTPEESLTPRKRTALLATAERFLQAHPQYADCSWRIDLVAIEVDRSGSIGRLEVIRNVIEP